MEVIEQIFSNFPLQIVQSIVVAFFLTAVVQVGRGVISQGQGVGAAVASLGSNIGGVLSTALDSVSNVASYNPYTFTRDAIIWILLLASYLLKYVGPIVLGYIAFSLGFAEIEEANFRSIYILPGVIIGLLLSFQSGRQLVGGIGWMFLCVPFVAYVFAVLTMNVGYWMTVPMAGIAAIFFDISFAKFWEVISSEAPQYAWQSLFPDGKPKFLIGDLYYLAHPPLAKAAISFGLFVSAIISLRLTFPALTHAYHNSWPKRSKAK